MHWTEPRWSYRARLKSELAKILNARLWLRVLLWVVFITTGMAFAVQRAVPDLEFNWCRALAESVGLFAMYFGSFLGLLWFFPPCIRINHKGICCQHGQSVGWRMREDIQWIIVDTSKPVHPRLHVEVPGKKPWNLGIGAKVNMLELVNCLRENFSHALIEVKK